MTLITDAPVRETTRSPGRPRDEQATRAIANAALRQLDAIGYGQLSMESVAHEAGVSKATIYRRFKDKADLITAAIAANIEDDLSPQASIDPRADLVNYLERFDMRVGEGCIEVIGTLLGSHGDKEGLKLHRQRIVEPRMSYLAGLLKRAQELGELDASLNVDLAIEMLAGSVFARRIRGSASSTDWAERAVTMIWR